MSLRLLAPTPWVRDALTADPVMAMTVEVMARTAPYEGTLRLDAQSWRGPFRAIIHTAGADFNGYRGTGRLVTDAIEHAMSRVPEATA